MAGASVGGGGSSGRGSSGGGSSDGGSSGGGSRWWSDSLTLLKASPCLSFSFERSSAQIIGALMLMADAIKRYCLEIKHQ